MTTSSYIIHLHSSQVDSAVSFGHLFVFIGTGGAREARRVLNRLVVVLSKEGVGQSSLYADSPTGLQLHHLSQQIDRLRARPEAVASLDQILVAVDFPLRESDLHLGQIFSTLPQLVANGRAEALKDFEDLSNLRLTVEERLSVGQFVQNAANRPNIDASGVDFASEQHLRGSVPEGNNLMSVAFERQAEAPGQAKVSYLDSGLRFVDEKVAGLQVSVHDASLVAVEESLENLVDDGPGLVDSHRLATLVQVLLHVQVEVLEHQVQPILAVYDVEQVHDVLVAQFSQ